MHLMKNTIPSHYILNNFFLVNLNLSLHASIYEALALLLYCIIKTILSYLIAIKKIHPQYKYIKYYISIQIFKLSSYINFILGKNKHDNI